MGDNIDPNTIQQVQNILQDLVANLLLHKPEEPIPNMLQYLQDLKREGAPPLTKDERIELHSLKEEQEKLKGKLKAKLQTMKTLAKPVPAPLMEAVSSDSMDEGKNDEVTSSDSEDEDEKQDTVETQPLSTTEHKQKLAMASRARTSVSAEVFGKYHQKAAFKPQVIAKSEEVKKKIEERLRSAFMFMSLEDADLQVVIDAMDERAAQPQELIIKEGDPGDVLYIVEAGDLSCTKVIGGEEKFLKKYKAGDVFGELALLYNAPRAATIKAEAASQLWVLDRNTFNHIVKDASQKKRQKYENFLSTVPILSNMDHYERSKMADAIRETKVASGEVIIKQGEAGEVFYILVDGAAMATLNENKDKAVMNYKPGDYFGELALLRGEPRAANVIASADCKLISLDRKSFRRLLGPLDKILMRNMGNYQNYMK